MAKGLAPFFDTAEKNFSLSLLFQQVRLQVAEVLAQGHALFRAPHEGGQTLGYRCVGAYRGVYLLLEFGGMGGLAEHAGIARL